uniref:Helicase n=1 Tax=Baku virus TaxID=1484571 RepID=A0A3P8MIG0_9REOV|nr:helicase [Baku virus]
MFLRLIVLAPGDVIQSVESEIRGLGVDVAIDTWKDGSEGTSQTPEEGSRGNAQDGVPTRGPSGANDVSGIPSDRSDDASREGPPGRNIRDGAAGDVQLAPTDPGYRSQMPDAPPPKGQRRSRDTRAAASTQSNGDGGGNMATSGTEAGPSVYLVATERIAALLRQRGAKFVEVLKPGGPVPPNSTFLWLGPQALKSLGAESSESAAQKDSDLVLHRMRQSGAAVDVVRIHGAPELTRRFPGQDELPPARTSVALVSNRQRDVPRAHILFSAPTGDTNWKSIARGATRRANIRAYAYEEMGSVSPGQVLLHLITSS